MKNKLSKVDCKYGAPMGRMNNIGGEYNPKLHLVKLKWIDSDYTEDGTYWGNNGTDNVYWAYDDNNSIFVRAKDRISAKVLVMDKVGICRFYN